MSDDIPVGSPPAPPGRHAAPGGWYADPAREGQERYWDGWNWTRNVRPAERAPGAQQVQSQGPRLTQFGTRDRPGQSFGEHPQGTYAGQYAPAPRVAVSTTADGVPLAGWWFRVLALIMDFILVSVVAQALGWATGISRRLDAATQELMSYLQQTLAANGQLDFQHMSELATPPERYWLTAITAAVFIAYNALMLRRFGATLGKLATGLRVVPIGQGRHEGGLPWLPAIVRPALYQAMTQLLPIDLINVLFPLWDRGKQTLHDKIARTQVIRTR